MEMNKINLSIALALILCIANKTFGQQHRANLMILVNDELIEGGFPNFHITINTDKPTRLEASYVTGDLFVDDSVYNKLQSVESFTIHFDYYDFNKKEPLATFQVALTPKVFDLPYMILNIYDFRDKKYKKWYQEYTEEKFMVNRIFPNSGRYIRKSK